MNTPLEALLRHPNIWLGNEIAQAVDSIPSGFAQLDAALPGGGWPRGALTEVLTEQQGIGELRLCLPALCKLSATKCWLVFIAAPHLLYAPALANLGVDTSRCILVNAQSTLDKFWAMEQALRSGICAAAILWSPTASDRSLRRLQLAAEQGKSWGVFFGPADNKTSPAALRLHLSHAQRKLRVRILKRRGNSLATSLFLDIHHAVDSNLFS